MAAFLVPFLVVGAGLAVGALRQDHWDGAGCRTNRTPTLWSLARMPQALGR